MLRGGIVHYYSVGCRAFWVKFVKPTAQSEGPGGQRPGGPCAKAICRIELQPDTPGTLQPLQVLHTQRGRTRWPKLQSSQTSRKLNRNFT